MDSDKKIPVEGYRFWPQGKDIYIDEGKNMLRYIFYEVEFTNFELEKLEEFKATFPSLLKGRQLPEFFTTQELVRILIGCKFKIKKAGAALLDSISWREKSNPRNFVHRQDSLELLESGTIYLHGVDFQYRPLIVLNVSKLNLSKYSALDYCALLCYILDYTITFHMIPGQIENWIIITDLCKIGVRKLPIGDMRKIINILQSNFRCRMIVNYVVNAPASISFLWRLAKPIVDPNTIRKIRICSNVPNEIRAHFMPNQLEAKYGGNAPNTEAFWPPVMPPAPYSSEEPPLQNVSTYDLYVQSVPGLERIPSVVIYKEKESSYSDIEEEVKLPPFKHHFESAGALISGNPEIIIDDDSSNDIQQAHEEIEKQQVCSNERQTESDALRERESQPDANKYLEIEKNSSEKYVHPEQKPGDCKEIFVVDKKCEEYEHSDSYNKYKTAERIPEKQNSLHIEIPQVYSQAQHGNEIHSIKRKGNKFSIAGVKHPYKEDSDEISSIIKIEKEEEDKNQAVNLPKKKKSNLCGCYKAINKKRDK